MLALLEIERLTQSFGGLVALNQVTLSVREGEILAIIGPNGAGKTTLFNTLSGAYRPASGEIRFDGHSLVGRRPSQVVRAGIARTFQNIRLFKSLTVLENILVGRRTVWRESLWEAIWRGPATMRRRVEAIQRCEELMAVVGLEGRSDNLGTSLPYGEQRLVEIARALAAEPRLLLLDEPAAGMNSSEKQQLMTLIRRIRDHMGKAIILIEHDMNLVMELADRVVVLDYGEKIADGKASAVQTDARVLAAYLGTGRRRRMVATSE